jgi:hypothetical protein
MVVEPKPKPPQTLSNDELLDQYAGLSRSMSHLVAAMGQIEMVLHQRMVGNSTKTIDHDEVTCQMGTATTYPDMLMSLRETVGEERWTKGFTPAHQETKVVDVPDKFDMRVVNGWKSLGNHVTDVIDHATDPYSAKLTLRLKKQSTEEVTA